MELRRVSSTTLTPLELCYLSAAGVGVHPQLLAFPRSRPGNVAQLISCATAAHSQKQGYQLTKLAELGRFLCAASTTTTTSTSTAASSLGYGAAGLQLYLLQYADS